jgi:hypothetical protein
MYLMITLCPAQPDEITGLSGGLPPPSGKIIERITDVFIRGVLLLAGRSTAGINPLVSI